MDVLLPDQTNPTLNLGTVTPEDDGRKFKLVVSNGILPNLTKTVTIKVHTWHPDAAAYLTAVETADGQALEPAAATAWDVFFRQMDDPAHPTPTAATHKIALAEGTMIPMLGARTLAGALIPAYANMPMPTNVGFVTGDYDRAIGLIRQPNSAKRIDTELWSNFSPRDDVALFVFITEPSPNAEGSIIGPASGVTSGGAIQLSGPIRCRARNQSTVGLSLADSTGFAGWSRSESQRFTRRADGTSVTETQDSNGYLSSKMQVFTVHSLTGTGSAWEGRLLSASLATSIDLAYMDSCLTTLQSSIAAALA